MLAAEILVKSRSSSLVPLMGLAHGQHGYGYRPVRERMKDCFAESSCRIVILDRHNRSGSIGSLTQCRSVERFDAVGINHARENPVTLQLVRGFQSLMHRGAGSDQRDAITCFAAALLLPPMSNVSSFA